MGVRKPKNRRLQRVPVLAVKVRSEQVRRSRARWLGRAAGLGLAVVLGGFGLWRAGLWALNRLVYQNPAFAIRVVEVQSDGVIPAEQLRRWANVRLGENLLALNLARVKRDLELVPLINSVALERILPGTLRLRITERVAVAQVNLYRSKPGGGWEAQVFLLDGNGFVMSPLAPRERTAPLVQTEEALPMLTGFNPGLVQPGRCMESAQIAAALELIERFAVSPMAGLVDVRSIDISAPEVLVVSTGQGSVITFGLPELDRQLHRWREIHELGLRMNRSVAAIDLAVSNNVPVRWLEANVTPAPAKPAKPSRTRKRHV